MIFGVMFAVSIAMLIFEFHRKEGDFENDNLVNGFLRSVYLSITSLSGASVSYTSVTMSGRIMAVGYGIFILVCIASFTAETASFLIAKKMTSQYGSITEVLAEGKTVCFPSGMQRLIEAKLPSMKQLGVPLLETGGVSYIEAMEAGTCDYSIIGEYWLAPEWSAGRYCNYNFIGRSVISFPVGFWASDALRPLLGWAVAHVHTLGAWQEEESSLQAATVCEAEDTGLARRLWAPSPKGGLSTPRRLKAGAGAAGSGGSVASYGSSESGPKRLGASHMLGAALIPAICLVIAAFVRIFESCVCGIAEEDRCLAQEAGADAKHFVHVAESDAMTFVHNVKEDGKRLKSMVTHPHLLGTASNRLGSSKPTSNYCGGRSQATATSNVSSAGAVLQTEETTSAGTISRRSGRNISVVPEGDDACTNPAHSACVHSGTMEMV